jgi:hypothetical protein
VTTRANQKLAFRFFGPYTVLQCVGRVAYKLQLPASSQIHPVFHVSQLKAALGRQQVAIQNLPAATDSMQVPMQILQRRMIQHGGLAVAQVKVTWSDLDPALATWEDTTALKERFPCASAWGQVAPRRRGMSDQNFKRRQPTGNMEKTTARRDPNVKGDKTPASLGPIRSCNSCWARPVCKP